MLLFDSGEKWSNDRRQSFVCRLYHRLSSSLEDNFTIAFVNGPIIHCSLLKTRAESDQETDDKRSFSLTLNRGW